MPLAPLLLISSISLAIWLYLATARGAFWRLRNFDDDIANHEPPSSWPAVVAVVPARNEAAAIEKAVTSLLLQNYRGDFSVILVDDHSEDATAQLARQAANRVNASTQLRIHAAAPLPQGWTGKLWALSEGVSLGSTATLVYPEPRRGCAPTTSISPGPPTPSRTASNNPSAPIAEPTYYWFTDADIVHAPDTLQRLVARAEHSQLGLTSLMVLLQAKAFPELALMPAFLFFFLKLYPPRWITNPTSRTAGAAGGCILLRSEALQRIGGLATIRSEVIDDCALAQAVKRGNGKIWMGLTRASISHRAYTTFREIRDMIARTAFTQLQYSSLLLVGTLLAMFLTYLAPIALLFAPNPVPRVIASCTWLLMSLLFLPTIRFYRLSPAWTVTLPVAALFYTYATFLSAARYYAGRGAQWKGRSQTHRPR